MHLFEKVMVKLREAYFPQTQRTWG